MPVSDGLSHLAMSVPAGTLTEAFRAEVVAFYGRHFGWRDVESLRRPDRMTLSVGGRTYVNLRERSQSMTCHGYEHFGLLLQTPEDVDRVWADLAGDDRELHLEPLASGDEGDRSFRFRYLWPFAVEVQFLPPTADMSKLP